MNNLILHLKALGKEEQRKSKLRRSKVIIKIRKEKNKIDTKKIVEKIKDTKSQFFEKNKQN